MSNVAVVAGVGPVVGSAVAESLADAGRPVALLSRTSGVADDLAAAVRERGGEALSLRADVTDEDDVAAAFERVRSALGPVEVLVHNASAAGGVPLGDCSPADFERVWRTRAYGGFLCARAAEPDLRETGGTVLFSGTSYGVEGSELVDWVSGAFATRGLAESLAADLGTDGATVTYVAIGARVTPGDESGFRAVPAAEVAATYRELVARPDPPVVVEIGPE